ncbi:MarR family winged helix-turn-helix transcriptional regulator [Steroidobacter flavus]|uniref:MarR family winged helix-turn-helix transcriptional regulator n=1 Tax=Steroidobacter flavus TaxID=1842136 RepID=A0ABV8SXD5_9GAMM
MTVQHYTAETFKTHDSLGYLLKTCHSRMLKAGEKALAAHDLSFMQWVALMKLKEGTAVTAAALCQLMSYDTGALTRLLDQLEARELVERRRNIADRRIVDLKLTPAGLRKVDELLPAVVECLNDLLAAFSLEEVAALTRLLAKLQKSLAAYE